MCKKVLPGENLYYGRYVLYLSGSIAHEHGRNEFTGAAGEVHNQTIPLLQHLRQQQLGHLKSNDNMIMQQGLIHY